MLSELDVIKYTGGPHHITILCKNKKDKQLYVFYCKTHKLSIDIEQEISIFGPIDLITSRTAEINISIAANKKALFYLVTVKTEDDFDLIERVVNTLMED